MTDERGARAPTTGLETGVVTYTFTCDQSADRFQVEGFRARESLNEPYRVEVDLLADSDDADTMALLGQDVVISVDRAEHQRLFAGLVSKVTLRDDGLLRQSSTVEVVPALKTMELTRNTRIFQDQTAVEILERVLRESLQPYRRELDLSALSPELYARRDYCVQYQESHLDFVHRLMEEEGIGYHFVHGDRERLVLTESNAGFAPAPLSGPGPVAYSSRQADHTDEVEAITRLEPSTQLRPTELTVRDHDWTRVRPRIEGAHEEHALRPREVYEHGLHRHVTVTEDNEIVASLAGLAMSAALPTGLPLGLETFVHDVPAAVFGDFTSNDIAHQVRTRAEALTRDASIAVGESTVIGFAPGATFDLIGHPTLGADGTYVLTDVAHESALGRGDGSGASYQNRFRCLPIQVPWRPRRRTRKPSIHGVQTATVEGPMGMDVHTDHHGRIRARFHWDRRDGTPSGDSTCWLRVSQVWAGQGFPGFLFIPRVGMEVIVSFVDGDPDRPLVMGCVYNGKNPPPQLLPIQATKSMIRTRTVPHGPGYNELSFEDAMGMERVHVRAQRDLEVLTKNDHKTVVERNQYNRVLGEQDEVVHRGQTLTVGTVRNKTVVGDEHESSLSNHTHDITGSATRRVGHDYQLVVERGAMTTTVVEGEIMTTAADRIVFAQHEENFVVMDSEGDDKGIVIEAPGARLQVTNDKIEMTVGGSSVVIEPGFVQINGKTMPAPPAPPAAAAPAAGGGGGDAPAGSYTSGAGEVW